MSSEASLSAIPLEATRKPALPSATVNIIGVAVIAAVTGLADFLLYGHALGIGFVLFLTAVAAAALVTNSVQAGRKAAVCAMIILIAGLLPFVVNPSILSLLFAVVGLALFATLLFAKPGSLVGDVLAAARRLLLSCFYRAPLDLRDNLMGAAGRRPRSITAKLVVWFMPVTLGVVFAALFVRANPLLESWVRLIDLPDLLRRLANEFDVVRLSFWLMVIMLVWPVLFVRAYRRRASRATKTGDASGTASATPQMLIVGQAAILRSLIVFNTLFALQTVLDALYLWGGVALPQGMTHAEYAHRGAYPLIVTALLAAGFVILALRPGSEGERSPLIRGLVYLWIAQNIWLVISSILRLDLYVEAYALTYWRVAAFIWMMLVAIGLALILMRIVLGRSNAWLIGANLASLALVLYICAFPNFAGIIATYNVAHCAEMGGGGPALDRDYLYSLGAQAIPAADEFVATAPSAARNRLATEHLSKMQDWRAWNYLDWRLGQYLAETPTPAADSSLPPTTEPLQPPG